jgi:thioredoxin 1
MMAPVYKELSNELGDDVSFVKIDADTSGDILEQYKIFGLPTFAVFKDGKMLAQKSGAMPKETLASFVKSQLLK